MAPPPIVTGLSPNESPPGTRITIRGENFGSKPSDLIGLTICGFDCLLSAEWKSSNKIIAISGPVKGKGDVIVTTRYGGIGTCTVTFKGYFETIGPMKESAVWVEEAPLFVWGRHSLSTTSYQQEDPLGLSIEGNETKLPEDDLITYFPEKSGDITMENFTPAWFLLENHLTTSFNDLQAGLLHLKRKVESQKEGQLSFLKANISSVVDQIDTLVNLRERCSNCEQTSKLICSIQQSEVEACKLFEDVLMRRDRAEKTRNALNVFQRFRFLFCLPCCIQHNIEKAEYDIVINDYIRVKNLFQKTDVPLFKLSLLETEKRIGELQKKLHTDLQRMPIGIDDQKRLIWYLNSLEAPFDYANDAIRSRSDYIMGKLTETFNYYKQLDSENSNNNSTTTINNNNNNNGNTNANSNNNKAPINEPIVGNVPVNVLFIEEVSECVRDTVPDLWKIGQSFYNGELRIKMSKSQQQNYHDTMKMIIEFYGKLVRASIIPLTLEKSDKSKYGGWLSCENEEITTFLPDILRCIRTTYNTLIKLDIPSDIHDIVLRLLFDLRIFCMGVLFRQTTEQVKSLHENWKIKFNRNKHIGITETPLKFAQLLQDAIQIIKESILSVEQREYYLLEVNSIAHRELNKQIEEVLMGFHKILQNLSQCELNDEYDVIGDGNNRTQTVVSQLIGSTAINGYTLKTDEINTTKSNSNTDNTTTSNTSNNSTTWERRQLICLSNCLYTKTVLLDALQETLSTSGFPMPLDGIDSARRHFDLLESCILDKYVEQKSDPLVGTIEPSMYLGHFDWNCAPMPSNIRPYVKECINNFIHVHSEVNSVSTTLLNKILPSVVQTIAEEFYRLMACVKRFNKNGSQQAHIDINVLQLCFQPYTVPKATFYFDEALKFLPKLDHSDAILVHDIVGQCMDRMKIQLQSLLVCQSVP